MSIVACERIGLEESLYGRATQGEKSWLMSRIGNGCSLGYQNDRKIYYIENNASGARRRPFHGDH